MYRPVPRGDIAHALMHLRDLFRRERRSNDAEHRAYERREAGTRTLLSNLGRTNEQPTLRTVLEIAEMFSLTLDAAHQLFGYYLDEIRELDFRLNGGRTRIIESYPFERDLLVDLPAELSSEHAFAVDATLRDLVRGWQTDLPIRALNSGAWRRPGAFYVQVGTEDSLGSSLPPGALALVEPPLEPERQRPEPRGIYLLQFGNGYRCSRCVVSRGKLLLLVTGRDYKGPEQFAYPADVRIAGRIRMFALGLPMPEYSMVNSLPRVVDGAPLILPWEQPSMDQLFSTEHRRFRRSGEEKARVRETMERIFHSKLTGRTERRYRRPTASQPHVDTLIQIAVANITRYTDSLRANGSLPSDRDRFSLETLLNARRLDEVRNLRRSARAPEPAEVWDARRREFPEWPPLLSLKFPRLQSWEDRIVRLSQSSVVSGLEPTISPGSLLLLGEAGAVTDPVSDAKKSGWSRPMYALSRGAEFLFGYLDQDGNRFAIRSNRREVGSSTLLDDHEVPTLRRIAGIAAPV